MNNLIYKYRNKIILIVILSIIAIALSVGLALLIYNDDKKAGKNIEDDTKESNIDIAEINEDIDEELAEDLDVEASVTQTNTVSNFFKSRERIWFYVDGAIDKNVFVNTIFHTKPDGTIRYYTMDVMHDGTEKLLGKLSQKSDEEIIADLDSELRAEGVTLGKLGKYGPDDPSDSFLGIPTYPTARFNREFEQEKADYFKKYVADGNLKFWFSIETDASGNNVESEYLVFQTFPTRMSPYSGNADGIITDYYAPMINEMNENILGKRTYYSIGVDRKVEPDGSLGMDVLEYKLEQVMIGDIYDSTYLGFKDNESKGVLITKVNIDEIQDISFDEFGTDGVLIDEWLPEGYEKVINF